MDVDCLFNILLYSDKYIIEKILLSCKYYNSINTEFFWKSLFERDYKVDVDTNNWNKKYILYNCGNTVQTKLGLTNNILSSVCTALCYNFKNLKYIPVELSYMINLKHLYFCENELRYIPKELGNLINLVSLYLSHNKIEDVPKELSKLINLELFCMNNNKLKSIPKEIGNLVKLRKLWLNNNNIKYIPDEFHNLVNLEYFCIDNKIKKLPQNLKVNKVNYL